MLDTVRETRRHRRAGDSYLIDYYIDDNAVVTHMDRPTYTTREGWSTEDPESIALRGYLKAQNWRDSIEWYGVPIWVKFHNMKVHESADKMTSETLYDFYSSDASRDFVRGMGKISRVDLDVKTWAVVIPVILGVGVAAMWILGVI